MQTLKKTQSDFLLSILKNQPFDAIKNPVLIKDETLHFYQDMFFTRLSKLLRHIYPVACAVVNEENFLLLAQQFIIQHPPAHPNIIEYGHLFNDFLIFNYFEKNHPFLPDLTRLEWAWYATFHGKTNNKHDLNTLLTIINKEQEETLLSLPANAKLLRLNYAVYELWLDHQLDHPLSPPTSDKNYLILWQEEEKIKIEKLLPEEFLLLKLIEKNKTLEEVCYFYQTFSTKIELDNLFSSLCQRGCIQPFVN